jgi:type III restriction enzyme
MIGGNYNPDFMVESKGNRFFVLEVKARDQINDEDVQAKARAGLAWCRVMSKATGKVWEYKLILHDAIQPTASFRGIISNAVGFG